MSAKFILWDFDGTLAYREGMWAGALASVANWYDPVNIYTIDAFKPALQSGFPWHSPEIKYGERTADQWWSDIQPVFHNAFLQAGVPPKLAVQLSESVRYEYTKLEHWNVYDDVHDALSYFADKGWRQCILSNHIPELANLVNDLDLDKYFELVFSSANIGYEKPHLGFYEYAISRLPKCEKFWMVGDNYSADISGAESANIPAVLVRNTHHLARLQCNSLSDLSKIID